MLKIEVDKNRVRLETDGSLRQLMTEFGIGAYAFATSDGFSEFARAVITKWLTGDGTEGFQAAMRGALLDGNASRRVLSLALDALRRDMQEEWDGDD